MALPPDYAVPGNPALRATDYNAHLSITRQSRITSANGLLFNSTPGGGTTLSVVKQPRQIRSKSEFRILPFALGSVNLNATAKGERPSTPNIFKVVYVPEGAVDVAGGWANCLNDPYDFGQEKWAKDGDWYFIADETGIGTAQHRAAQADVDYVFLHVRATSDSYGAVREAVVTNSQKIPEDFKGHETDCICLGRMTTPTQQEIDAGTRPKVLEQYVSGQVQVYDSKIHPWKLNVIDIGQNGSAEWAKTFFFSDGGLDIDDDTVVSCLNRPYVSGGSDKASGWFFIAPSTGAVGTGGTQVAPQEAVAYAYLHAKKVSGGASSGGADRDLWYVIVTNDDSVPTRSEFGGEEDFCVCLGHFTTYVSPSSYALHPTVAEQYVTSQIQIPAEPEEGEDYPFKLQFAGDGEGGGNWQVYLPDDSLAIGNITSPQFAGILSGTNTGSGNWKNVVGSQGSGTSGIYIFGYVEYSSQSYSGIDIEGANQPNYFRYFVAFGDDVTAALTGAGITVDSNRPWRYFRVKVGSVSGETVVEQCVRGAVSMMAPVETMGGGSSDNGLTFTGGVEDGNLAFAKVTTTGSGAEQQTVVSLEQNQLKQSVVDKIFLQAVADMIELESSVANGETSYRAMIDAEHIYHSTCSGEDCFAIFKKSSGDTYAHLEHSGTSNLKVSDVQLIRDAFEITAADVAQSIDASVKLAISHLMAEVPAGAATGTRILGVTSSQSMQAQNADISLLDTIPASVVNLAASNAAAAYSLSNWITADPTDQNATPKLNASCIYPAILQLGDDDEGTAPAIPLSDAGSGTAGTATTAARSDHRHPLQAYAVAATTEEQGGETVITGYTSNEVSAAIAAFDTSDEANETVSGSTIKTINAAIAAAVTPGHSELYARADHTHPLDLRSLYGFNVATTNTGSLVSFNDDTVLRAIASAFNWQAESNANPVLHAFMPSSAIVDATCTSDDCIAVFKSVSGTGSPYYGLGLSGGYLSHSTTDAQTGLRYSELKAIKDLFSFTTATGGKAGAVDGIGEPAGNVPKFIAKGSTGKLHTPDTQPLLKSGSFTAGNLLKSDSTGAMVADAGISPDAIVQFGNNVASKRLLVRGTAGSGASAAVNNTLIESGIALTDDNKIPVTGIGDVTTGSGASAVTTHNLTSSDIAETDSESRVIDTATGGDYAVAPADHAHSTEDIFDGDCSDLGNCFAVVGSDGFLTHSQGLGITNPPTVNKVTAVQNAFTFTMSGTAVSDLSLDIAKLSVTSAAGHGVKVLGVNDSTTGGVQAVVALDGLPASAVSIGVDAGNGNATVFLSSLISNNKISGSGVSVGAANKWLKSDANGCVSTTDETPITLTGVGNGLLTNTNGTLGVTAASAFAQSSHTHAPADIAIANSATANRRRFVGIDANSTTGALYDLRPEDIRQTTGMTSSGSPRRILGFGHGATNGSLFTLGLSDIGNITADNNAARALVVEKNGTGVSLRSLNTSDIHCDVDGHKGNCLLTVDNDGNIDHSGNLAYNLLFRAKDTLGESPAADERCLLKNDIDPGEYDAIADLFATTKSGSTWSAKLRYGSITTASANGASPKAIGFAANASADSAATLLDVLTLDATKTGVLFNTNGALSYKAIGSEAGQVAAGDHTHDYSDTYAAKTHSHDGYAAFANSVAANQLLVKNSSGEIASSGISVSSNKISASSVNFGSGVTNTTDSNLSSQIDGIVASATSTATDTFGGLISALLAITNNTLSGSAKVPLSAIDGSGLSGTTMNGSSSTAHSGNCLVTIDTSGNLGHSGNKAYTLLADASNGTKDANKIITDKDLVADSGLEADATSHSLKVKLKSSGGISAGSDGLYLGGLTANKWCKTDASGALSTTDDTPVVLASASTGFLYNSNGTLSYFPFAGTGSEARVARSDHNHTGTYAPASTVSFPGFGTSHATAAYGDHTHTHTAITDLGDSATKNVGTGANDVAAGNHTHGASDITDSSCTSGGDCLAYFDSNKKLAHLGNSKMTVTKLQLIHDALTFTMSGGVPTAVKLDYSKLCATTSASHGVQVLGLNAATAGGTESFSLISGLPSSAVVIGKNGSNADVFLSSLINSSNKINGSNVQVGSGSALVCTSGGTLTTTSSPSSFGIVDTSTDQTVGGVKTFSSAGGVTISGSSATLDMKSAKPIRFFDSTTATAKYSLRTGGTNGVELYLFADNSTSKMLLKGSSTAITLGSSNIDVVRSVLLSTSTVSASAATTATYQKTVPDVNWVASLFLQKPSTTGVVYHSGSGATSVKTVGNGSSYDIASGSHTHTAADISDLDTSNFAPADHDHNGLYAPFGTVSFPGYGTAAPGADTANGSAGAAGTTAVSKADHTHKLNVDATVPAAAGGTAAVGTATTYARRDHVHPVKFSGAAQGTLAIITGASDGTVGANGTLLNNGNSALSGKSDIAVLRAIAAAVSAISDNKATFAASSVYDQNCTSGGDCLAYFDSSKKLAHLGTTGITKTKLNKIDAAFSYTGSGTSISDAKLKYDKICSTETVSSPKAIGFNGSTSSPTKAVSLLDVPVLAPKTGDTNPAPSASNAPQADVFPTLTSGSESDANKIARIGTSSYAARADHKHPITFPTSAGSSAITDMTGSGVSGGSYTAISGSNSTTWSAGGTSPKGVKIKMLTRLGWRESSGELYFRFRTFEFSKDGRLVSISSESAT